MQPACNVSLRFPISGEPKPACLALTEIPSSSVFVSCVICRRGVLHRARCYVLPRKNKKFRSPFPFFLFRVSEICRAPVDNLANFHPNKGGKRKNKSKGKKRNFCFLFSFFFGGGRRVLKFVENTGDWLKF